MSMNSTPTPEEVREAKRLAARLGALPQELVRERDAKIAKATKPLRDRISEITDEYAALYDPKIREAKEDAKVAKRRLDTLSAARAAGVEPPLLEVKLVRWSSYGLQNDRFVKTGDLAIVEVWGPESKYPGNLASYSIPEIGSLVLRYLKKNGEPSTKFAVGGGYQSILGPHYGSGCSRAFSYYLPEDIDASKMTREQVESIAHGYDKQIEAWKKRRDGGSQWKSSRS